MTIDYLALSADIDSIRPNLPARLLVVDDDRITRTMLANYLQQEGYTVAMAQTGSEALRMFDEFGPDVICLDYTMPDMNGNIVAQQIRARNDLHYVPILMLTASGESVKIDSMESGVDAFLTKPVSQIELKTTLRTLLRIKTALDRVVEVQNALIAAERLQMQPKASGSPVTALIDELNGPLRMANEAAQNLRAINPADSAQQQYITMIKTALNQASTILRRESTWTW